MNAGQNHGPMSAPIAIGVLTLAGLALSTANAQVQYTAQDRWIEIMAYLPGETPDDTRSAAGFGQFDETLSGTLSNSDGSAWAYASQNSQLTASGMTAIGAADGGSGPPVGTSAGVGRSYFYAAFSIAEAVDYTLDLDIMGEFASWSFQGTSLDIDRTLDYASVGSGVHLAGTLDAGDYAFSIYLESGAAAEGLGSNFDFTFTAVPAPAGLSILATGVLAVGRRRR